MNPKPSPKTRKMVVIENNLLSTMSTNREILTEFPFLKSLQSYSVVQESCCGRGADSQKSTVFTAAKQTLAGMGVDKKRRLKELLNADKVQITYKSGANIIQLTF